MGILVNDAFPPTAAFSPEEVEVCPKEEIKMGLIFQDKNQLTALFPYHPPMVIASSDFLLKLARSLDVSPLTYSGKLLNDGTRVWNMLEQMGADDIVKSVISKGHVESVGDYEGSLVHNCAIRPANIPFQVEVQ